METRFENISFVAWLESKFIFEAKWQLHFAGAAAGMARGKLVGGKVSCSWSSDRQCSDAQGGNGYGKETNGSLTFCKFHHYGWTLGHEQLDFHVLDYHDGSLLHTIATCMSRLAQLLFQHCSYHRWPHLHGLLNKPSFLGKIRQDW